MEMLVLIFVIVLLCLGFLSCFINKIPGPLFVVIAVLTAQLGMDTAPGWGAVAIVTVIAIAAFVLSKYMTRIAKKMKEYSKKASIATTIASLLGVFSLPAFVDSSTGTLIVVLLVCFILLPFLFALLVEWIRNKNLAEGAKCAGTATLVYLADTALKLAAFAYAVYAMFMTKG